MPSMTNLHCPAQPHDAAARRQQAQLLHDISNPLTAILLVLDEPSLSAATKVDLLRTSSKELASVVKDARYQMNRLTPPHPRNAASSQPAKQIVCTCENAYS